MQTALAFLFVLFFSLMAAGQQAANVAPRVTQPVDLEKLVTLRGNTHPLARPEFDRGVAPDSLPAERILLVLQRSPEQEKALRKLLDEQQIKASPNYHMWLTPEQFGQQYGPADADIQAVTDWLTSQGFRVNKVAAGRTVIEFSGTAGQVRQALHTELHKFAVNGEEHWANASDPQIPAALAPVVAGFASLNNFPRKPMLRRLGTFSKSKATGLVKPLFTYPVKCPTGVTGPCYLFGVGPGDFATIYNLSPLYNASPAVDGTGQTIAVVAQTNINIQDARDFRTMFGLPAKDPQIILNGPDPGILSASGDEGESDTDVEWVGAVAKGATIDLVVSEGTEVTAGIDLSALYIIDNDLAPVMTESYGGCEAALGNGGNAFYSTLWEQGAAQGITILEAAGDSGSAGCDVYALTGVPAAEFGLMVSGMASTPFNAAVGGTDFSITSSNWQTYWNVANGSPSQSSAISYIPEMTWNDSCANTGVAADCTAAVISSDQTTNPGVDLTGGGGGPSNCINPIILTDGSFGGCNPTSTSPTTIYGYPKPSWQTGTGVPADSARDTPDVSLFAGNGMNGSFYVFCEMDANDVTLGASATSCDLNSPYLDFQGAGGTSIAAQAFGGIMALVNQKTGERQGNANYILYPLAAKSGASCASNAAMAPTASSSSCIFYDTQTGNNSVACVGGSPNCSNTNTASGNYGILVVPSAYVPPYTASAPGWPTTAGYDLATGLGTVNAYNLVQNWKSTFTATTTTLSLSPTTITHGQSANFTVNVSPTSATGDVSLIGGPSGGTLGIGPFTLSSGTASGSTVMLPGGTYNVTAHYAGNGTDGASDSSPVQLTVSAENSQTFVTLETYNPSTGLVTNSNATSLVYGSANLLRMDVTNSSGNLCAPPNPSGAPTAPTYPCPTGYVTVTDNGSGFPPSGYDVGAPSDNTPGTYNLNSQGTGEDHFIQLPVGKNVLAAAYTPYPIAAAPCLGLSYCTSASATDTITVTQAPVTIVVTPSTTTPQSGENVTLTAAVSTSSFGLAPTGTVQFFNGNSQISGTPSYTPTAGNISALGSASLTATLTTSFTASASITATYSGDANYQGPITSSAVAITIGATPDFSLNATPSSFTITSPGQSGTTTVSASQIGGFTGTVSLSCSLQSTMTYSSCSLNPTSFSIPGGSSILTVSTTAPSAALRPFNHPGWFIPGAGALFACILLLLTSRKKRRVKLAFGLLMFVLLAAALVDCGGGSSTPPPSSPGTPTGTYTATVTAISGKLTHTLNISVTVE
jgi:hypothetical protein